MFESKPTYFTVIVISEIWDNQFVKMTFRYHLPAELRWRAIGRLEVGQKQIKEAKCEPFCGSKTLEEVSNYRFGI